MMTAINLAIFFILIAGNCRIWTGYVNRTHAIPLPEEQLRHFRWLHDIAILGFPIALFWCLGFTGPHLLLGGSWHEVTGYWWGYLAVCLCGFLFLFLHAAQRFFRPSPKCLLKIDSQTIDIAAKMEGSPIGDGPHNELARIPRNEAFTLEMNRKTIVCPGLPDGWTKLSILHLTDWHMIGTPTQEFYDQVTDLAAKISADLVVFTGDLIDRKELIPWIDSSIGRLDGDFGKFFILGNHDWYAGQEGARERMKQHGWVDVASRVVRIPYRGRTIAIAGSERPWMGTAPELGKEKDVDFRIALCHTPDLVRWASSQKTDVMLSGHNHGGQIQLPLIGAVYSPSFYGVKYADGLFQENGMILHVGRGLAARHPLRINCRPEVTLLEFVPPELSSPASEPS